MGFSPWGSLFGKIPGAISFQSEIGMDERYQRPDVTGQWQKRRFSVSEHGQTSLTVPPFLCGFELFQRSHSHLLIS